jgi:asparagine synthase (glutamine-hydrolysing)
MISDVPIGAFLSGGLDSSSVVAFMARHSSQPVKTFSIGFRDANFDELAYARSVATAFGTDHHEFVVDAEHADMLPMLARHVGEPFADSSIVPTYQVAQLTRSFVTVALNGDGGDEMFGGYDRYRAALLATELNRWPPASLAQGIIGRTHLENRAGLPRVAARALRFMSAMALDEPDRYLRWGGYFNGSTRRLVAGDRLAPMTMVNHRVEDAARLFGATHPAERFMAADVFGYLPDDLLVKVDIATMACSLEARSPLLDHRLMEFVAQLPTSFKLSVRRTKILLRESMHGILPDEVLNRRRKMGFSAPIGAWLRGPLRPLFEDTMTDSLAAADGYLNRTGVYSLFTEHVDGRSDRTMLLWNLLMLELWFREVLAPLRAGGGRSPTAPPVLIS